jgi:hypothetical protein
MSDCEKVVGWDGPYLCCCMQALASAVWHRRCISMLAEIGGFSREGRLTCWMDAAL